LLKGQWKRAPAKVRCLKIIAGWIQPNGGEVIFEPEKVLYRRTKLLPDVLKKHLFIILLSILRSKKNGSSVETE
jgi:hypothetical protein